MVKIVRLTSIRAYLTLCYLSLTCSSLNSLNKSACLSAESGMSAPADRSRLVEKADARSERWKYFAYVADNKGKPTDSTKPVCKQCFKSVWPKAPKRLSRSALWLSVTVKPRPLWLQAVRKQREAAHRHAAPLSHKVHKVPILIKREKVLFLAAGYRGTFLVSVYRATLAPTI